MRSATLKWIMLLSSLLVVIIMGIQLFWLNKIYSYEQKQFNVNVAKCIRGLYDDLGLGDYHIGMPQKPIITPDPNTFIIPIEAIPPKDTLASYASTELVDFDVMADCYISVYDKNTSQFAYSTYLPDAASRHPLGSEVGLGRPLPKNFNYMQLYFPHREQYILSQLFIWISGSILLLMALLGLSASLMYLYRQKTLNEVQKDFVNNFTHEFKTPIAVIKLATDVLINPSIVQKPDRLLAYANIIKQQNEHLQHQVERLLKTANTDQHKLNLEKENFDISDLVREVLRQLDPLIKENAAQVDYDADDQELRFTADKSHLSMVLVNLIENAIKYSMKPHVLIKATADEEGYCLSVKDNGVGIEKKYIKFLFKKFFRVPTGNVHNVKGFGLGLNFVKQVVDAHRGKITVNSLPGIGTEFKIVLPKH
ncbi:MAG: HAMP domain-containing histidine kinase [Williamsia sp.]|nr:HAMP domain-containing histidine kinase [Williamsia sp.]